MLYPVFTKQELESIYHSYTIPTDEHKKSKCNWFGNYKLSRSRNKAILSLMIYQGLCTDEVNRLTIRDVKLKEGNIFIAGTRKSNERTLELKPHQVMELMEYTLQVRQSLQALTQKAVKRNIDRFPEDFMFELNDQEFENLRSQFDTSRWGGTRYAPMAFTEQGVAMLSSVLNSKRAIAVNIQIIRVFTRMRQMLMTHKDILLKLEKIEKKISKHDEDFKIVFRYLKELLNPPTEPMRKIGFKLVSHNQYCSIVRHYSLPGPFSTGKNRFFL